MLARTHKAFTAQTSADPLGVGPSYDSDLTFMLARREDFLFVQVDAWNMHVVHHTLRAKNVNGGVLVFTFPPQSVGELAYPETAAELASGPAGAGQMAGGTKASPIPAAPGGAYAMLSGWSRLAFFVSYLFHIPYTVAGLLDWYSNQMDLAVVPTALPSGDEFVQIQPPTDQRTAIEMPFNVVLSPITAFNIWSHPVAASLAQGASRYELWRTRLTSPQPANPSPGNPLAPDGGAHVRAVWNFDVDSVGNPTLYSSSPPGPNDLGPLGGISTNGPNDRWNLVRATTDGSLSGRADIPTRKLWLSSRGGFADWHGSWDINIRQDPLRDWAQLTTLGRDQYVRVVTAGYLYPWGLPAVASVISEREFQLRPAPDHRSEAALRQITFLTVLDPDVTYYDAASSNPKNALPFSSLKTLTLRTPPVNTPGFNPPGFSTVAQEIQKLDGSQFGFHFVGTDWMNRQISFIAAALFVEGDYLQPNHIQTVRDAYNSLGADDPRRFSDLGGQVVAFAPPTGAKPGGTDLHVTSITFGAGTPASGALPFIPSLAIQPAPNTYTKAQAVVRLAAAEQISGGGELPGNATPSFAYHSTYVEYGFDGNLNKGDVYLADAAVAADPSNPVVGDGLSVAQSQMIYGNGSGGGLLTPNISISAISRSVGPVAGEASNIAQGLFDPSDYFGALDSAKFLGGMSLADVLTVVNDFTTGPGALDRRAHDTMTTSSPPTSSINPGIPAISYAIQQTAAGEQLVTTVNWSPSFGNTDPSSDTALFVVQPDKSSDSGANLTAVITTNVGNPKNTTYQINGEIDNFGIQLLTGAAPLIEIDFTKLTFSKATGSKTKVTPSGITVTFLGALEFLNDLQQLFAAYCNFDAGDSGATGGASVSVTPAGVVAELSVTVPPIELGMFTLAGIGFAAILTVPLDGVSATTFEFDFASANDPFTLSAGIFGGGGYFQIVLMTHDIQSITLSFDFGAMMALDLYVASGQASIVAGFSFTEVDSPTPPKHQYTLIGFVKLGGSLTILGIFSLSIEFDLQLEYQSATGTLTGTATVEISVGIFCLHVSFSASVTATFAGGNGAGGVSTRARLRGQLTPGGQSVATFADQMPLDSNGTTCTDWQTYAAAFIPPAP